MQREMALTLLILCKHQGRQSIKYFLNKHLRLANQRNSVGNLAPELSCCLEKRFNEGWHPFEIPANKNKGEKIMCGMKKQQQPGKCF